MLNLGVLDNVGHNACLAAGLMRTGYTNWRFGTAFAADARRLAGALKLAFDSH